MLDQRVWSLDAPLHLLRRREGRPLGPDAVARPSRRAAHPGAEIGPGPALPSPRQSSEQFRRQALSVPLRHGTSPEEIARAVLGILALPAFTGQMLALDGGQHLQ